MHGAAKDTLQQALSLAKEAVRLDTEKDSSGAVQSYIESIDILDGVVTTLSSSLTSGGDTPSVRDEIDRVSKIRDTYIGRVKVLSRRCHISNKYNP
ncbi:hypothetical protein ONZ45_g2314 [Pleurotus djamor]|nr:hypothetical protein ONZ45_g2314 [Pleurotus djamor]